MISNRGEHNAPEELHAREGEHEHNQDHEEEEVGEGRDRVDQRGLFECRSATGTRGQFEHAREGWAHGRSGEGVKNSAAATQRLLSLRQCGARWSGAMGRRGGAAGWRARKICSMGILGTSFITRSTRTMRIVRSACARTHGATNLGTKTRIIRCIIDVSEARNRPRASSCLLSTLRMRKRMSMRESTLMRASSWCIRFERKPQKPLPICGWGRV